MRTWEARQQALLCSDSGQMTSAVADSLKSHARNRMSSKRRPTAPEVRTVHPEHTGSPKRLREAFPGQITCSSRSRATRDRQLPPKRSTLRARTACPDSCSRFSHPYLAILPCIQLRSCQDRDFRSRGGHRGSKIRSRPQTMPSRLRGTRGGLGKGAISSEHQGNDCTYSQC
jgi:hypothetical protein